MLKKLGLSLCVLAILAGIAFVFRDKIGVALLATRIAPEHDFDHNLAPAAPDYDNDANWAALPSRDDPSDSAPEGAERDDPGRAGVFFIHPTTFFAKDNWNQPLDAERANWVTDQRVLRHQASVFNGCCEVFAPRYRQATFFAFIDDTDNGRRALSLAYTDVRAAFENFLQRNGRRPFLLAGHSQGARHAAQLLREEIAGTPLEDQLIAAYAVGFSIQHDQVGGLPVCDSPGATGCVMGWNTTEAGAAGLYPRAEGLICINPLSWRADGTHAEHAMNLGGIGFTNYLQEREDEDLSDMQLETAVADAQCVRRNLAVSQIKSARFESRLPGGSLHVYDFGLFYMNIRENARHRVNNFLRNHEKVRATGDS